MSDQELQHFAAKVYLKAFVDPALAAKSKHQLWVYAAAAEPQAKGVRRVGGFKGYYEIGVPGQERLAENQFNKLETIGSPILRKLRSGIITLTREEKEIFALFIAASFARVPASRALIDAVQREFRRQHFEFILEDPRHIDAVARSINERGNTSLRESTSSSSPGKSCRRRFRCRRRRGRRT